MRNHPHCSLRHPFMGSVILGLLTWNSSLTPMPSPGDWLAGGASAYAAEGEAAANTSSLSSQKDVAKVRRWSK